MIDHSGIGADDWSQFNGRREGGKLYFPTREAAENWRAQREALEKGDDPKQDEDS